MSDSQATQISKSGLSRKLNNAFRRRVVEFEQGVREAKIEAMPPDVLKRISDKLSALQSEFDSRMEQAELEIMEELDAELDALIESTDVEYVMAVAEAEGGTCSFDARYDMTQVIKDHEAMGATFVAWAKDAPIAEVKEKYSEALKVFEEEVNKSFAERYDLRCTHGTLLNTPCGKCKREAERRKNAKTLTTKEEAVEVAHTMADAHTEECGTCGRPWVDGRCEGGFVNHLKEGARTSGFPFHMN